MPYATQIPSEIVRKWQEIVDLLAEIIRVPSALIMRVERPFMKVIVSSESKGNPYVPDGVASLNMGPYCETVLRTRQPLLVSDALRDEQWRSSPEVELGMISYLGVPISWPDGEMFGTICVLDNKSNEYSKLYLKLMLQWRDVLQSDLGSITRLHRELEVRDAKIRRLVDSNIIGIVIWRLEGRIVDANDAFLRMVGYDLEDLVSGRVRWTDMTPPEWRDRDTLAAAELKSTGTVQPLEKEYFREDGSRVSVLIGVASFEESGNQCVAFVLDLSDRKRAEAEARESERRYRETQIELAHANRVATLGQLTASIAHEVKQPIAAAVTSADAGLRWLAAQPPDLEEVRNLFAGIIKAGDQASEVIGRIRGLIKKAPERKAPLDLNEAILEAIALTRSEMGRHRILLQTELANGLPRIWGDRVQLQQVILNLIMNAIEAMSEVGEGSRELLIGTSVDTAGGVIVTVRDSGPGVKPESLDHLFDPFYTTKPTGMGMGLSICRSITEAHGGRLWAAANVPHGASLHFSLPSMSDRVGT
jgi:PAS domain S-box-containing protein